MENKETKKELSPSSLLSASIIIAALIIGIGLYGRPTENKSQSAEARNKANVSNELSQLSASEERVLPSSGVELPVLWGDMGLRLVSVGAIDADKMENLYKERGTFTKEYDKLLNGEDNGKLKITRENSGYVLNLLWALGLASKNPILDSGEMMNKAYGGAQNFASTAGWTLAKGNPMDHYSRHKFFNLTPEQQALVDRVSRGIYRPCCNNSTHFPDCNHGMAMLGLLELMVSQGVSEQEMWKTALAVNSYWFPDTYLTIAAYMKNKGVEWEDVNPQEVLGINYSSASGYARIASQVTSPNASQGGGSGCSVGGGQSAPAPVRQQTGCGI